MPLREDQRVRFARHLLLAELGDAEQSALCEARVAFTRETNPGVQRAAADYLKRAGVEVTEVEARGAHTVTGAPDQDVERVAGSLALLPAAEALLGAFSAVEQIKRIAGVGTPGAFPPDLQLSRES